MITEHREVEIQDVEVGDRVWSCSMWTDEWELKEVEGTPTHNYAGDLITIGLEDTVVEATGNHPFWVAEGAGLADRPVAHDVPELEEVSSDQGRWVEARSLQVGDRLGQLGGFSAGITSLSQRQEALTVYNLSVEGTHTYAVSHAGLLVHNKAQQIKPVPSESSSVTKTFDQARTEAFEKAGMTDPSTVKFTKVDPETGTVVEFKGPDGAKVSYDSPHSTPGPGHDSPHVGWQTGGKRGSGGAERGNIPYEGPQHPSRSPIKGEGNVEPH